MTRKLVVVPPSSGSGGELIRVLDVNDTTIGNRIAHSQPVQAPGLGKRVVGVLTRTLTANLTVRIKKAGVDLDTITIPMATAIDTPIVQTAIAGVEFIRDEVLTWDITAGNGQRAANGIASITVEWA